MNDGNVERAVLIDKQISNFILNYPPLNCAKTFQNVFGSVKFSFVTLMTIYWPDDLVADQLLGFAYTEFSPELGGKYLYGLYFMYIESCAGME